MERPAGVVLFCLIVLAPPAAPHPDVAQVTVVPHEQIHYGDSDPSIGQLRLSNSCVDLKDGAPGAGLQQQVVHDY